MTANEDDRTLTVVPIGLAQVAATVPLDIAPGQVGATPNSDLALVSAASALVSASTPMVPAARRKCRREKERLSMFWFTANLVCRG